MEDDERRHHVEADLRRCARRVDRRRRGRALGSGVVYVGTGNQSGWSFTIGKGVYKSTDAGKTWTNIGLASSQYIGGIVVDPRNADTVLVAVLGPRRGGAAEPHRLDDRARDGERGVYRSTDGGRAWTRVLPTDGSSGASDVYIDYRDPQIVYALLGRLAVPTAAPQPPRAGTGATSPPTAARPGSRSARAGCLTARASRRSRLRRARTAGVCTPSPAPAGAARRRHAACMDPTTAASRGRSARGNSRAPAARCTRIRRIPTSCTSWARQSTDRPMPGSTSRRSGARRAAPTRASSGSIRRTRSGCSPASIRARRSRWTAASRGRRTTASSNGQFYRVSTDYDFPYHVCGPQQDSGTACVSSRSDFGEIRPNDWYSGGGFENGFLIADPLDKRYMYTQGWYHVLRRFDRATGQVIVLYQPTSDDRFGGAPPLAFSPRGSAHAVHGGAVHARVRPIADRPGARSARISRCPGPPRRMRGARPAGGVGAPAPGGSIQSLALSPVTAGVIWVGTSTGLIQVTRDDGKTWTNVTPPKLPPASINVDRRVARQRRDSVRSAALARRASAHLSHQRLRQRAGRRSRRAHRRRGRPRRSGGSGGSAICSMPAR